MITQQVLKVDDARMSEVRDKNPSSRIACAYSLCITDM